MSDNTDIGLNVDPGSADGIERIVTAIDRLHASLGNLSNSNSGLTQLEESMKLMQATMVTGFAEMAAAAAKGGNAVVAAQEISQDRQLKAQLAFEAKQVVQANRYWDKQVEIDVAGENRRAAALQAIIERRDVETATTRAREAAAYVAFWDRVIADQEKAAAQQIAIEQKRDTELHAMRTKEAADTLAQMEKTAAAQVAMEQRRDVELNAMRQASAQHQAEIQQRRDMEIYSAAATAAARQLEIEQRRDVELNAMRQASAQHQAEIQQRRDVEMYNAAATAAARQLEIEQRRDTELNVMRQAETARIAEIQQRRDTEAYNAAATAAARQIEIEQRRDTELNAMRQRAAAEAAALAQKTATEAAAAAEKQRLLNSAFTTSSLPSQISSASRAQAYGSMGGNASATFGSAAATADIAALKAAHQQLQQVVPGSTSAINLNNTAMNEAHSLARGLAGSLGGLWLTYGSVAPLLAGAAIAASLKNVVSVGKEVENQLNFVFALSESGKGVDLNQFIAITDSSLRSVVESANAMRALAQNGLEASQSLQVLPSILDLATVGEMSVTQAAIAATGATSAFGLSFAEAGRVADIFAKTAATSNTSVIAITESMRQASTVASLFHVSIEETAATLGVLAKINVTGGAAGTSMTNMLTGLYEPTEKGKKAMKELGLETMNTATGALKPFTQVMEDLRGKLAGFNDSAKVDLLGSIFTVRGVKAVQQVQENLDEYKKKIEEAATASGYMREVVEKLENSTDGAFKRLGVTVENSFVKAFDKAGPYVQQLGLHLGDLFKEGSNASTGIANFASNVAQLSVTLLDNANSIAAAVAGYTLWKLAAASLGPVLGAATAASAASTAAQAAATAASIAHSSAMAGGAGTLALYTAMVETQAAATVAATAATTAWSAVLLPTLGALAIAVAAGAALWLLFRDNTDEADKANTKISNSLHVVQDSLDKEIERLEKSNKLWDERNGKFRDAGEVTPDALSQAAAQVAAIEAKIKKEGANIDDVRNPQIVSDAGSGAIGMATGYSKYADALATADMNLARLTEQQRRYNEVVKPGQAREGVQKLTQQTVTELDAFAKNGTQRNSRHEFYQQNEAIRNLYLQANAVKAELLDPTKRLTDVTAETDRVNALRTTYKQLQDQVNSAQAGRAPKVDKKRENSELAARLKDLDTELQLTRMQTQADIAAAQQQNKRGEIGDLQLINVELAAKLALDKAGVDVAQRQYALADAKDKIAKKAVYDGKVQQATLQGTIDTGAADEKRRTVLAAMAAEGAAAEAKELTDKGQYLDAFLKEYESKYQTTIEKVTNDLAAATDVQTQGVLSSYLLLLTKMRVAGADNALAKQLEGQFGNIDDALHAKLTDLSNQSGAGAGLVAQYDNAKRAAQAYANTLPVMIAKQKEMQALATKTGSSKDQKAADGMLSKITDDAQKARQVFIDLSKTIGSSLEEAFGRGGKALGQLTTVALQYGDQQQQIQDRYEKSQKSPEDLEKKQKDMASAQISAYGDMASAAAGFFGTQSKGYQTLMTVSKVFHAAELASTMAELVPKAISAVLSQGEGDPYTAFTRMAAMTALVAGLGVAIGGGSGGDTTAADRQKANGTGSVLGDSNAKSSSISRSIELTAKNSNILIDYTAAMAASLNSIQSNIGSFTSLLVRTTGISGKTAADTSAFSSKALTAGGVVGGALGGAAVAGALTMGFATILTAGLGAVVGAVFGSQINKIATSIFGGAKSVTDTGLTATKTTLGQASASGIKASQYTDVTTSGGWFSSDKHGTQLASVGQAANDQFTLIVKSLAEGVTQAAKLLGVGGDAFSQHLNQFVVDIGTISTKGLTGTEIQTAIEAAFSKMGDDMANWAVAGLGQFQKVGEGSLETLVRLATDYAKLDGVLQGIGMQFGSVGLGSLKARENLIALAGGIDTLASQTASFSTNFLTSAQRLAPVQKYVTEQMTALGLASVNTRADFAQVVLGLDLSRPEAQATYVALMALQDAFAKTHAATEDLTKTEQEIADERKSLQSQLDDLKLTSIELAAKERAALDASNRVLYDEIQAYKKVASAKDDLNSAYEAEKTTIQSTIDRVKNLSTTWKKFASDLVLGTDSPLNTQDKYSAAKSQFDTTLAAAKSGDTAAQDNLTAAASAFLEASKAAFASGDGYTNDFNRVVAASQEAAAWAESQVNVQQASLDALTKSVSTLVDIKAGVLSVADAIAKLAAATAVAQGFDPAAAVGPSAADLLAAGQLVRDISGLYSFPQGGTTPAYNPATSAAASTTSDAATAAAVQKVADQLEALRKEVAAQADMANNTNIDATMAAAQAVVDAQTRAAAAAALNARNQAVNA